MHLDNEDPHTGLYKSHRQASTNHIARPLQITSPDLYKSHRQASTNHIARPLQITSPGLYKSHGQTSTNHIARPPQITWPGLYKEYYSIPKKVKKSPEITLKLISRI